MRIGFRVLAYTLDDDGVDRLDFGVFPAAEAGVLVGMLEGRGHIVEVVAVHVPSPGR